jgi:hypothetical protein
VYKRKFAVSHFPFAANKQKLLFSVGSTFPFAEFRKHGDMEMETWKHGDIDMGHGNMEKRRLGDMDMSHGH